MKTIDTRASLRRYQMVGLGGVVAVMGVLVAWAMATSIAGAVIASGVIMVEGHTKKIQHADGGIVAEIAVKEGEAVRSGQLLVRLDDTEARAHYAIVRDSLYGWLAERARLIAQRDGAQTIVWPRRLIKADSPAAAAVMADQEKLMGSERVALAARKSQLGERIAQYEDEISGLAAQAASVRRQTKLAAGELVKMKRLKAQGLVASQRVLALEREVARLTGQAGRIKAQIAAANGRIAETRLELLKVDDDARATVLARLREVEAKFAEYGERVRAARARLARTRITAPRAGIVHRLMVHTIGAVVAPGEKVVEVVPQTGRLVIAARVRPSDIDQVHRGQPAIVRLPGLDAQRTPRLAGEVKVVAADLTPAENNTPAHYAVELVVAGRDAERVKALALRPGMPVDAFIRTRERSPMSYLLQPFLDRLARAFREG